MLLIQMIDPMNQVADPKDGTHKPYCRSKKIEPTNQVTDTKNGAHKPCCGIKGLSP